MNEITTREQAAEILESREGTPPEHLECCSTEDIIVAAKAPSGQPCSDCGALVVYSDDWWQHVNPNTGCFLAHVVG